MEAVFGETFATRVTRGRVSLFTVFVFSFKKRFHILHILHMCSSEAC